MSDAPDTRPPPRDLRPSRSKGALPRWNLFSPTRGISMENLFLFLDNDKKAKNQKKSERRRKRPWQTHKCIARPGGRRNLMRGAMIGRRDTIARCPPPQSRDRLAYQPTEYVYKETAEITDSDEMEEDDDTNEDLAQDDGAKLCIKR